MAILSPKKIIEHAKTITGDRFDSDLAKRLEIDKQSFPFCLRLLIIKTAMHKRIRFGCMNTANHNLNRLLDEAGLM